MDIYALLKEVVSFVGAIPIVYAAYLYLGQLVPTRHFLGFGSKTPLDIIVTTSEIAESAKGAKVTRATTGIGQVQGVAHLSKFLGKYFRKKKIRIRMSKNVSSKPDNDLVLLGGPSKNEYSKLFIECLVKECPELQLVLDDNNSRLSMKNGAYDISDLDIQDGLPKKDIGLVIVWRNPFSSKQKRAIYCAGMTSYGTSGSVEWLFEDVLTVKSKKTKAIFKSLGKKSPCFVAVLEMSIVNRGVVSTTVKEVVGISG